MRQMLLESVANASSRCSQSVMGAKIADHQSIAEEHIDGLINMFLLKNLYS